MSKEKIKEKEIKIFHLLFRHKKVYLLRCHFFSSLESCVSPTFLFFGLRIISKNKKLLPQQPFRSKKCFLFQFLIVTKNISFISMSFNTVEELKKNKLL